VIAIVFIVSLLLVLKPTIQETSTNKIGATGIDLLAFFTILAVAIFVCYTLNLSMLIAALTCTCLIPLIVQYFGRQKSQFIQRETFPRVKRIWTKSNLILFGLSLISFYLFFRYTTLGGGHDAQEIWNFKAHLLLETASWKDIFLDQYDTNHRDYPLFIPIMIAFLANAFHLSVEHASIVFHFYIYLMLLTGIWLILKKQKVNSILVIGVFVSICFSRAFVAKSASQYADTTIAMYLVWMYYWFLKEEKHLNYFSIAVLLCSFLWVKNEAAVLFLYLLIPVFLLGKAARFRNIKLLVAGILIIVPYIIFKYFFAPINKISNELTITTSLFEWERYELIFKYLGKYLFLYFPMLVLFLLMTVFSISKKVNKVYVLLLVFPIVAFFTYCSVYLITPYEVEWHIRHSQDRLIHQFYPALLLSCALIINQSSRVKNISESILRKEH